MSNFTVHDLDWWDVDPRRQSALRARVWAQRARAAFEHLLDTIEAVDAEALKAARTWVKGSKGREEAPLR